MSLGLTMVLGYPLAAQTIPDQGDLLLYYIEPEDPQFLPIYESLERTEYFLDLVEGFNETFVFPQDIGVTFVECNEANAFYDPENVEIIMCYELIDAYLHITGADSGDLEAFDDAVFNTALFTFLHELGHALVDQYQLPITGREEDVVDEFAAMMLLFGGEEFEEALIQGILQFELDAEWQSELDEIPYWGEHSTSAQRFYTISCLTFGSDPEGYEHWVYGEDAFLPEERAVRCPAEFSQKENTWSLLLDPYFKLD
jgi:hypothetical protein